MGGISSFTKAVPRSVVAIPPWRATMLGRQAASEPRRKHPRTDHAISGQELPFVASARNLWPGLSQCTQLEHGDKAGVDAATREDPWSGVSQCTQAANEDVSQMDVASREDVLWTRLSQTMQWKKDGLLSESEFAIAKRKLGQQDPIER